MTEGRGLLVVDDEEYNRSFLRRVLGREHAIREADCADAALAVLTSEPALVVLCDHLMPGRSGADLAGEVAARWPNTVTLLLTGLDDDPEVVAAVSVGQVFEVVQKPCDVMTIRAALVRALTEATRRSG